MATANPKRRTGLILIWVSLVFPFMAVSTLIFGALADRDRADWPIWTCIIVALTAAVVFAYVWMFRAVRRP